jgi:uncharacterized membrane protein YdjX (TVP38/TMEM64 family)
VFPNVRAVTATFFQRQIVRSILIAVCLCLFMVALGWFKNSGLMPRALEWIKSLGPWAPVMFIVLYVAAVVLLLPASILTLGAGIVFGMGIGSIYVIVGATIATNLTFLLGRHLARDWIAHKLEGNMRFKALDEAVAREGWKIVALVRFAPIFPFAITSYGFGLTSVPFWQYFLASFAMIPGALMYVYLGVLVGDLAGIEHGIALPPWLKWTIAGVTFLIIVYVARFARRVLGKKMN